MPTRRRWSIAALVAAMIVALAYVALATAAPAPQEEPEPSTCTIDLGKYIDPDAIVFGESAEVTLVVSGTCPVKPMPVDMVFLVDESVSMSRDQGGPGVEPLPTKPPDETPDPSAVPPTKTPGSGAERTPGHGSEGGEPPFCNPGVNYERTPTATPTRRWPPWRTPTPGSDPPGREPTPIGEYAGDADQIREIKSWLQDFVSRPEIEADYANGRLRTGFVSFSTRARIRQNLTDDPTDITSSANRLRAANETKIDIALREAERALNGTGARTELGDDSRLKVVVVLSDFQFCNRDVRSLGNNIHVFSVGFGVRNYDRTKLGQVATGLRYVSERHAVKDTLDAYEEVAVGGRDVFFDILDVHDELDARMRLVPDSVDPPTVTITGQLLEWHFEQPTLPLTLGYAVEPLATGRISVSQRAGVLWTDTDTGAGSGDFPPVMIDVVEHTPTPTPTSTFTPTPTPTFTPTSTPTPTPSDLYLPITFKLWPEPEPTPTVCKPELQVVDVALVIDTSISMSDPTREGGQPKLDAAIEAADELVRMLKPADQAAVIGFNATATVATVLTSDRNAISAALHALPDTQAQGTSIDVGLRAGLEELTSQRHVASHHQSIILVTDGRQTGPGGDQAVRDAAQDIHDAGIKLIVIGLGDDVDEPLLRSIVSDPALYFQAPNAEDLVALYRQIARYIPCP